MQHKLRGSSFELPGKRRGKLGKHFLEAGSSQLEAILFPSFLIILKRDDGGVVVLGLWLQHLPKRFLGYRSEVFLLIIVIMKHHTFSFLRRIFTEHDHSTNQMRARKIPATGLCITRDVSPQRTIQAYTFEVWRESSAFAAFGVAFPPMKRV